MSAYRDWLDFHIDAQLGMFIDEVIPAPGRAGKLIFSMQEAEPMWNLLFVDVPSEALRHEKWIAEAFAARGRRPVWYLADSPDQGRPALPSPWQPRGQNTWMARGMDGISNIALPEGMTLRRVLTPAQAEHFNQLYLNIFWEGEMSPNVALPIPEPEAWAGVSGGSFKTHHWLLYRGEQPAVMLTTLCRGERAGLYNVGTEPKLTRRGYATLAIRAVLAAERREGLQETFLLTECDPGLEHFYARLDFRTVATGRFYCRREAG